MFISIYILHLQIFVQKSHSELKHILQKSFEQNGENSQSRARKSASYFVNLCAKKKTGMVTIMLFYAL